MLLELTPDQESLRETTARYLTDKVPTSILRSLRVDAQGFTDDYWRQGLELGWTHLLVDERLGGGSASGDGLVDLTLLAYEFGRRAAPGPLLVNAVVAGALSDAGGHDHVVEGLLDGRHLATWALLEHPRRDELGPSELTIRVEGDELVLDGVKRPVESAARATHVLVTGTSVLPGGAQGPTQVLVPTDTAGVGISPLHSVDLTRRFDRVTFDGVRIPADAVVGQIGGAAPDVRRQLRRAIVIGAAESVGTMQTAFDMTLEWTRDRYSFGRPLAAYQAIKHRMAHMATWLEASHAIADEAARAAATLEAADAAATIAAAGATSATGDDAGAEVAAEADKLASAAAAYIGVQGSELLQE
ncbi:MAG: acyl-CoA/acyl-ACP dehydrogenase, partial [Actinomycetota bacterium]|nr:acyl-CoA/acyl-ACP dehydrogenase [Actinomycetota bacterium]